MSCRSGSTSEPKGVMITHANLADNLKLIVTGLSAVDDTVVVGWLPQVTDEPSQSKTHEPRAKTCARGCGSRLAKPARIVICLRVDVCNCGCISGEGADLASCAFPGVSSVFLARIDTLGMTSLMMDFIMGSSPTVHTLSC